MSLPSEIPARYAEEDAGYMSMRPVVEQTFRLQELADMVVSVVGKDATRVQQVLRAGTIVYNGYRYWWDALAAESAELAGLLALFPEDEPSRPFQPETATSVLFEIGGGSQRISIEIDRAEASRKRLFGNEPPWMVLLRLAGNSSRLQYEKFSHAKKADLYRISLPYSEARQLLDEMLEAAPRNLRHRWNKLRPPSVITFVVPRSKAWFSALASQLLNANCIIGRSVVWYALGTRKFARTLDSRGRHDFWNDLLYVFPRAAKPDWNRHRIYRDVRIVRWKAAGRLDGNFLADDDFD